MPIGFIWQTFLETPLINFMILLTVGAFSSFGFAILAFTLITRIITFPLTMRTMRSTRAMQELQPQIQELQKKYSDPRRRSEETMKLYKESGVNPLGCLGSQIIQFPLFIAMYQVIRTTLASTPEGVLYLESRLYDVDSMFGARFMHDELPLSTEFFFLDLTASGANVTSITLMIIVFAAMWIQQRISVSRTPATGNQSEQQKQMSQMMQWMLPIMFAAFVIAVPAGLGLYWAATTVIGIILHWTFLGPGDFTWGSLIPEQLQSRTTPAAGTTLTTTESDTQPGDSSDEDDEDASTEIGTDDGERTRNQRSKRRRGGRQGSQSARSQSRSSRRRRRPRR
jgi:YidC/Oxa1 family membrane protein insertase